MSLVKKLAAVATATALIAGLSACASSDEAAELGSESNPVKIGVVGASDPYWDVYLEATEEEGIFVELVDFADYNQPNPALAAGELDLNQFQHVIFLAQHNVASGDDLVPIGATAIYPLGLYSTKYDSVDDIKDGEQVIVPNDTSNQARALLVLQSAGLIELEDGGSIFSTLDDIEDSSRVEVTAADASFTATSLGDVAAAVVNNDFVTKAGIDPLSAIAVDDPSDPAAQAYINIFAARAEDKDNELFQRLVEIYQTTEAVQEGVLEVSGGTAILVDTPAAELEEALAKVEADVEANE
ncbi:MetQ/NlpA family ABC transporter substrate-binding protein [Salinibacterium sp. SYSU T00001]|uniref:MetQ/NlpA family ABC transporter substrate-binding protein n=1 Tax=Homoserinimonas sedimenticola TaxID=2986805 RepID=UPI002235DBF9|nr:MetQ/NlpA family ABC transporter substrate-binding protein [Salinibacterium sedimenticola]MCW4386404.1 MetQ/NlpA family ABC transporter substrate-binding protein [Salinibacterium sedimenticola]